MGASRIQGITVEIGGDTRKGRTGKWRWCQRRRRPCGSSTGFSCRGRRPTPSQNTLPTKISPRPRGRRRGGTGRWRTSSLMRNTRATLACRSATRWTSFPRSARRTKEKCRSITWRAAMTPSSSLQSGSSCRWRYSGGRIWGGAITAAARSLQS